VLRRRRKNKNGEKGKRASINKLVGRIHLGGSMARDKFGGGKAGTRRSE